MKDLNLVMPKYDVPDTDKRVPLGISYLYSILKKQGYSVKCQDLNFEKLDLNCEYLGVTVLTFCFEEAKKIVKQAKEKGICTIAGGPHAKVDPQSLLDIGFDYVVIGDGEKALPYLLENKSLPHRILSDTISDLNAIPLPDFSWVNWNNYRDNVRPIFTSRGCPYQCTFCTKVFGSKYRERSAENVVHELQLYDGRVIEIMDDLFTLNRKRVEKIRDLIKREKLNIVISLMGGIRIDNADLNTLKCLRDMNTQNINFGVESIHNDVLRAMKKKINKAMINKTIEKTKSLNCFNICAGMIIGMPKDTYKKSLKSLKWVQKNKLLSSWCLATPLPSTELYDWVNKNGRWLISPKDYGNYCGFYSHPTVMFETDDFSKEKRLEVFQLAKEVESEKQI